MVGTTEFQRQPGPLLTLAAVVLLAVLVGIVGRVLLSTHATERHGADAVAIRNCIQQTGASERWQRKDDANIEYWLCEIPDGRWCVMITQVFPSIVMGSDYRELSAFCPKNGAYRKVISYLQKFGVRIR